MSTDQREALERLIRERRHDYAGLSRLLGKNPAYIQQFIKRGTPRRLDKEDVQVLARFFGVTPESIGGRSNPAQSEEMIRVPRRDVGASAGFGSELEDEAVVSHFAFKESWLRRLCRGGPSSLSLIGVQGDSMYPTLSEGDDILVDENDNAERLRDGIYVLKRDDALMVKRLAVNPFAKTVTIKSDNPAYPEWRDCDLATLEIIGRVVWAARKVS